MPPRHAIKDADWERIKHLLPGQPGQHGKVAKNNRLFMDAILWISKTGAPWRDLPESFGNWNSTWRRLDRWAKKGVWQRVFEVLQDPDLEWVILDSTSIRAHPHAAGAKKKVDGSGGQAAQALGRSRGGFTTKIHGAISGLGLPAKLLLTPGQAADVSQAEELLEGLRPAVVIADKAFDSKALVDVIEARGAEAVIPSLSSRKEHRAYDRERYKDRNLVERFWHKLKQYRRVATRYEKTAQNFLAFVHVASIMILLR
jgi:transposase